MDDRQRDGRTDKTTIAPSRMLRDEMERGKRLRQYMHLDRPMTRRDCLDGLRPCPWVGCRYHLAIEVGPSGALAILRDWDEIGQMPFTCALDVAEMGGLVLEDVGQMFGLTRERIRQIEEEALDKARHKIEATE